MTRAERLSKLSHAIWDYRGKYNGRTMKWIKTPNPKAVVRVRKWLGELGVVDVAVAVKRIDAIKTPDEYRAFLKSLGPLIPQKR